MDDCLVCKYIKDYWKENRFNLKDPPQVYMTEMKINTKRTGLYGYGVGIGAPINFCPTCGSEIFNREKNIFYDEKIE